LRVLLAFDVDGTLACGSPPGPIKPELLVRLKEAGFIVGIVGNYERALSEARGLDFYLEGDPFKAENLARVASAFKPCLAIYVADLPSDREAALKAGFIYVSPRDLPLSLPRLPCTLGPLVPYGNACPTVDPSAYVDPSSRLVGRVCIGSRSAVFFGAVLRAEEGELVVGSRVAILEHCLIEATRGRKVVVGDGSLISHGAVVHGASVGHGSLVGIGAILLDGAEVGDEALVAAGSLLPRGFKAPSRTLVAGSPARVVRELEPSEVEEVAKLVEEALSKAERYRGLLSAPQV